MTEGPSAPHRRGKRDPELARELQLQGGTRSVAAAALAQQIEEEMSLTQDLAHDIGEAPEDAGFTFIRSGYTVFAKTTSPLKVDDGEAHWFSFGIARQVDPEEDIEEVYDEMVGLTNTAVLGMAADMQDRLIEAREEARKRPIGSRR